MRLNPAVSLLSVVLTILPAAYAQKSQSTAQAPAQVIAMPPEPLSELESFLAAPGQTVITNYSDREYFDLYTLTNHGLQGRAALSTVTAWNMQEPERKHKGIRIELSLLSTTTPTTSVVYLDEGEAHQLEQALAAMASIEQQWQQSEAARQTEIGFVSRSNFTVTASISARARGLRLSHSAVTILCDSDGVTALLLKLHTVLALLDKN